MLVGTLSYLAYCKCFELDMPFYIFFHFYKYMLAVTSAVVTECNVMHGTDSRFDNCRCIRSVYERIHMP